MTTINHLHGSKSTAVLTGHDGAESLNRGLGVGSIVFMVAAGAAPLGAVIAGWPVVVAVSEGTGSPLFFLIATAVLITFAIGFSKMTPHVHNAGAFYSYIQTGLGRAVGLGASMFAVGTYVLLFLALAAYVGDATRASVVYFGGPEIPWWLCSVALLALCGALAYRDVALSAKVLGVVLVVETLVVVTVNVAIMVQGGAEGLSAEAFSPARLGEGVPSLGVMFAFFSFVGFEAAAVFRNEARDPERTVPRAMYIAVLSIGVFYAFSAWAMQAGIGESAVVAAATDDPTSLVVGLAAAYVSPVMQSVVQVLLVTSLFACILTFQNVLSRYLFTLGGQQVLPAALAKIHPKHLAPSQASLSVTVTGLVLIGVGAALGLDPVLEIYTWFSGAATLGVVVLMALTSLSVIVFFRTRRTSGAILGTVLAPTLAFLGLTTIAVLVIRNFNLLVGGELQAGILLSVMAATFAIGLTVFAVMRSRKPQAFAALLTD